MNSFRLLVGLLVCLAAFAAAEAQMPIPHELLGHKRSTFKVPRTRPWDDPTFKYFGGGPDLENECGGRGHCFHRPAVWTCPHYFVPPVQAKWIIRGEGLGFYREEEDYQEVLFRTTDDEPLFSLSQFEFDDPHLAYRTSAQWNFTEHMGVEAVYQKQHEELHDYQLIDDDFPIELRVAGIVINSPVDPFEVRYLTRFQSGEVNLRYYYNEFATQIFGGFRWLEIDELLSAGVEGGAVPLEVETKNKLLGGQIGIEAQHWVNYGILRVDACIKGGIYNNTCHQITQLDPINVAAFDTNIAWVGESQLAANFPITKQTYLRVTYRLIHVAGIAVAADQINGTDLTVPVAVLNNDGTGIYHGWSVGLEAWW